MDLIDFLFSNNNWKRAKSKTRKLFNVRFNEYYELAYKYFSDKTGAESYQHFVRGIIENELDKLIEQENNK